MLAQHALAERVIRLAIDVQKEVGPSLLESVYETCLAFELKPASIPSRRQAAVPPHEGRLLTYLRMGGCQVGLELNFNALRLKDGLRRLVRGCRVEGV